MAVVRRNAVADGHARRQYIDGVKLLKQEFLPGATAGPLGILGADPDEPVSTYDLLTVWHHRAMNTAVPPGSDPDARNAAHSGPVFLPWHRFMLLVLEQALQRVLRDPGFGLPYWAWEEDGELASPQQQMAAAIRGTEAMGGFGVPVPTGPFAFHEGDPGG